ncbi:MAG: proteophosphoglycan ppg4, partial [Elusimicrobia bacterium]
TDMVIDAGIISSDEESVVVEAAAPAPTTSTTWPPRATATAAASKRTPSEKSRQTSSQPPAASRVPPTSAPISSSLPTGLLAPAVRSGPASLPACVGLTQTALTTPVASLPAATAATPLPSAATPYPLVSVTRRSRIGPMLETSSTTPQTPSAAPALRADLARMSLHVTPVVPNLPATSLPASAGPQAGVLVCAILTAPQVTVYASSAPSPPPADSPQSSLNPFQTGPDPPAKKRTRRLSSGSDAPARRRLSSGSDAPTRLPHHTRNERRRANREFEKARQAAHLGASPNPIPITSSSSTSTTSAPSTIPIPEADIGVRGGASYLKTPAEKRHASATSLSEPPPAGKASRTADPSLSPAESQAETLTPTGTTQHS